MGYLHYQLVRSFNFIRQHYLAVRRLSYQVKKDGEKSSQFTEPLQVIKKFFDGSNLTIEDVRKPLDASLGFKVFNDYIACI
jgi:hypothetical protein